ncbi:MAG: recombinase RecA [Planctomycetes bacterium]|nr:recombinase RecA [Planctomycetota bacterium]
MAAGNGVAEARDTAIIKTIGQIEKQYGKGSIMRLSDYDGRERVEAIPTGCIALDLALGIGGVPRGRIVEFFGPEASGKTTLANHVVAMAQRMGGVAGYIDAEHAYDPVYAARLGVKVDDLLMAQPDTGEQALEICETLVRSGAIDVIVIDSVAALVPKAEIEGEMGDSFVGLQARLMSQALRKLTALTAKSKTTLVFINQIREKIGVMFGSPETTTGGRALKFYSSVRIDIRRIGQIKDGEEPIGARTKATVVKNKVAPPFKKCEFDILFAEGINRLGEVLDIGVESGFLKRSGTWISYGETRLGQGREKAREFLKENPALAKEIEEALVARVAKRELDVASPGGAATTGAANSGNAGAGGSGGAAGSGSSGSGAGGGPAAAGARSTASRQQSANP